MYNYERMWFAMFLKTLAMAVLSALSLTNSGTVVNDGGAMVSVQNENLLQDRVVNFHETNSRVLVRDEADSDLADIINKSEADGKDLVERIYGPNPNAMISVDNNLDTGRPFDNILRGYGTSLYDMCKKSLVRHKLDTKDCSLRGDKSVNACVMDEGNIGGAKILVISGKGEMRSFDPNYGYNRYSDIHLNIFNIVDIFTDIPLEQSVVRVVIEEGVTSIGDNAFVNFENLEIVEIPNTVTKIGVRAFEGCKRLNSITIPRTVTRIGNRAFEGCTSLKSITIPGTVARIGDRTFKGCTGLKSITISGTVARIGDKAFEGCTSLGSVKIPNTVTEIGDRAFADCTSLDKIEYCGTGELTCEGENSVFSNCPVQKIQVPVNYDGNSDVLGTTCGKDIDKKLYKNSCPNLRIISDGICGNNLTYNIEKESGGSIVLNILGEGTMDDYSDSNPAPWYGYKDKINYVIIREGVTKIGRGAFKNISGLLSTIDIPSTVIEIGSYAFENCKFNGALEIPKNVQKIGVSAFKNTKVTRVEYCGNGLTVCSEDVFVNNVNEVLVNQNYSDDKVCGKNTFKVLDDNCNRISVCGSTQFWTLNDDDSILRISVAVGGDGKMCSYDDENLYQWSVYKNKVKKIEVEYGIKNISSKAFKGFVNLETVIIPSTVVSIENDAFGECTRLRDMNYCGNHDITVGETAFSGCISLNRVSVPVSYEDEEFCNREVDKKFKSECQCLDNEISEPVNSGAYSRTRGVFPVAVGLTAAALALQRHIKI